MEKELEAFIKKVKKQESALFDYEKKKNALHTKQSLANGHTDDHRIAELKSMGIDTASILKSFVKSEKDLKADHKVYITSAQDFAVDLGDLFFAPPPIIRDPNVVYILPPAVDGYGGNFFDDEDCGFNLALGETNFKASEQGSGWGLSGGPYGKTGESTLVFSFNPPRSGNILVEPNIDFRGVFAISANDHSYTSTHAFLNLKVSSKLYQHYWETGPENTILDESHRDSSNSGVINQRVRLAYSASVSDNDPVRVFIKLRLDIGAKSSHARADIDFRTGATRFIRVPFIKVTYI